MTGLPDFNRPCTDADRAVYEKWRPIVEEMDARRHRWIAENRRPDERLDEARARYIATRPKPELSDFARRLVRRHTSPATVGGLWPDDGQQDGLWALDHSTRRFRVRPIRPEDGAWWANGPGVTVIDSQTLERLVVPLDSGPIPPADTDAFGTAIFAMRDAWNARHGEA